MIPRFRPELGVAELAAVIGAGGGSDDVARFEADFAATAGQRFAVAFPYGRTGLLMLLKALGLNGCEVICPAYTCVVVPHAIVLSGNRPRFVDSGPDANMDLDLAEAAIGPDTRALVATSIFGHPVDLDRLQAIQQRHPGLIIIQDCAHSYMAEWRGQPVHRAGRAALFALNASKMMTSIFGGMVTTDDAALAARLVECRNTSLTTPPAGKSLMRAAYLAALYPTFWPPLYTLTERLWRSGLLDRFTRYYDDAVIDMPADHLVGLSNVEARVGAVQIRRLAGFIDARRAYAAFYRQHLSGIPALAWIDAPPGATFSHIAARGADKRSVMAKALAHGVQLGEIIEYSIPEMTAYRSISADHGLFPVSGALSRQTINLPASGRFRRADAEHVVGVMQLILQDEPDCPALSYSGSDSVRT